MHNHPGFHQYLQAAAALRLRARSELAEVDSHTDLQTLFDMLDPTKRRLHKLEKLAMASYATETRCSVGGCGPVRRTMRQSSRGERNSIKRGSIACAVKNIGDAVKKKTTFRSSLVRRPTEGAASEQVARCKAPGLASQMAGFVAV